MTTPSHIDILAALRYWAPTYRKHFRPDEQRGFRRAVAQVCDAIEAQADEDDLWTSPEGQADPMKSMRIGDHIAATRQAFGILP